MPLDQPAALPARPATAPITFVSRKFVPLNFSDFALHPSILRALEAEGFTAPTPIQEAALPVALTGRDLIGTAQTGTGKTAAFMLPALNRLAEPLATRPHGPRILVLAPTRELATQILDAARKMGKFMRLNTVSVLGGMPYREQLRLLARPTDLMVATPGRLIDLLERGKVNLGDLEMLILDEADRMLDMGFIDDVEHIAAAAPANRQTLLFTATFDRRMTSLTSRLLNNPERIAIAASETTSAQIEQRVHVVDDLGHKRRLLNHLTASPEMGKAIIFAATKRDADQIAEDLKSQGHAAGALHGDMTQAARNVTVRKLREGRIRLLVATDVAARGIDVPDITHVINFDLPRQAEDYVHRIGRTGRAGATGIAVSFASPNEKGQLDRIERYTGTKLSPEIIPGLEPTVGFRSGGGARSGPGGRPRRWGGGGAGGGYQQAGGPKRWGNDRAAGNGDRPAHHGERDRFPDRGPAGDRDRPASPAKETGRPWRRAV